MYKNVDKEQNIIASVFLQYDKKILVIRSISMIEQINDTEYYNIPTWKISFGDDPQEKIKSALIKLLDIEKIENIYPVETYSFMQDNGFGHIIGIVYRVDIPKAVCKNINECESLHFVDVKDIDSFIYSSRIKKIIKNTL